MAQNNSVFVQKHSSDISGKPKLTIDVDQVTNCGSLHFTWKKISA